MELEKEFWETQIKNNEDYIKKVMSVFATKNELTDLLEKIKNKNKKTIIDFGCGIGNSIPYLKEFEKIFLVDRSKNMLKIAKKKYSFMKNVEFHLGNLINFQKIKKTDLIIASVSIMPKTFKEFDLIIENFKSNLKKNGKIILILLSFESETFYYHLISDFLYKNNPNNFQFNQQYLNNELIKRNYNVFGHINTGGNFLQKHWLKEEIFFRLEKFNLKKIKIKKLNLDWEIQMKKKDFKNYPNYWMWLVELKI